MSMPDTLSDKWSIRGVDDFERKHATAAAARLDQSTGEYVTVALRALRLSAERDAAAPREDVVTPPDRQLPVPVSQRSDVTIDDIGRALDVWCKLQDAVKDGTFKPRSRFVRLAKQKLEARLGNGQ